MSTQPAKRVTLEHRVAHPKQRRYSTPLLLLHGAWHGAWCWQDAMQDFAKRGFEVHAISLRGHGASHKPRYFHLSSLADYVSDLTTAIDQLVPRPWVIGHSMGGLVVQRYLQQAQVPAAVLLCSIPVRGILPYLLRQARQHPLATLQTFLTLSPYALVGSPSLTREAFFRDTISDVQLRTYFSQISEESTRVALESALAIRIDPACNQTPLLVVAAERDRVFTLAEQQATASAYGAKLLVVPEAAHDLMLDPAWPLAADAMEAFFREHTPAQ